MRAAGFKASFVRIALASGVGFCVVWSAFYWLISDLSVLGVLQWGIPMGILFGLAFGWIMAHPLQVETTVLDSSQLEAGRHVLITLLKEMGYRLHSETSREMVFKPSFRLGLFTGKIIVRVEGDRATVEGPSHQLRGLTRLLVEVRRAL
jgi:hypothetical protein